MSGRDAGAAGGMPAASIVIATFNRPDSLLRLLALLQEQAVAAGTFELIVVDDESAVEVAPLVARAAWSVRPLVIRQANGGPAVARHAGIMRARGSIVVVLDDDMIVAPDFLSAHLSRHAPGSRRVVLGRLRPVPGGRLRLFERLQLALLDRLFEEVAAGRATASGKDMYTGNVSFRRADYQAVGGFDLSLRLSEDAELGVRLEESGVEFVLAEDAVASHASDHASLAGWMRRSVEYGATDATIARKHGVTKATDVWRYLFLVNPVSAPLLLGSALLPTVFVPAAWLVISVATALGWVGLERIAIAGATLAYGMMYFVGVRREAGSRRRAISGLLDHLQRRDGATLGPLGRWIQLRSGARSSAEP